MNQQDPKSKEEKSRPTFPRTKVSDKNFEVSNFEVSNLFGIESGSPILKPRLYQQAKEDPERDPDIDPEEYPEEPE